MSILKVARMGHPVLRARAKPLDAAAIKSPRVQQLIDDMLETMNEYQGVGLAAPQVHVSLRLFVAGFAPHPPDEDEDEDDAEHDDGEDDEDSHVPQMVLINPEISIVGHDTVDDWEGCLSIPEIRGRVTRARDIKVRAFDRNARRVEITARGFTARVIQHETDHLRGLVYLDRMKDLSTLTHLAEWNKYWMGIEEQDD